ncbi:MoaA/NifB/PqqE/SkfB family radical SAM enzyme [Xanthomonas arboricola]
MLSVAPTRLVLNFANRCALNCEWCYVPFGNVRAQKAIVLSVVNRAIELGFSAITFGGGDPFQYRYISELVQQAKAGNLHVHIDTHAMSLKETQENSELLENGVDLLGLPIDGQNNVIHDSMRSAPGHFAVLESRLRWLSAINVALKINTVASRNNIIHLPQVAHLVSKILPSRWSIYQYMPLGPGVVVSEKHLLEDSIFESTSSRCLDLLQETQVIVEVNNSRVRRLTYPIAHHDGSVYIHSTPDPERLEFLCSIFDPLARSKIDSACITERPIATTRYT